jgi:bifunctional DNA-binding transcriptional regulator/antitoxin component of YhaV-PrlF toxin-antitoxin module
LYFPTVHLRISDVALDDRGRLTLPKEVRERYGDRYHIVQLPDGIKLVPVAADPLETLRDEFADVEQSGTELREGARSTGLDEAGR